MSKKWNRAFWVDLAERVGSTFVYSLATLISLDATTPVHWSDARADWVVLGIPTVLCLLKGLAANLPGDAPSASVVGVTSEK